MLPTLVTIDNTTGFWKLAICTDGRIYAVAVDGMQSFPIEPERSGYMIREVKPEIQFRVLAETYEGVLRRICLSGQSPGFREMQRQAALAVGLGWKEPEGHAVDGCFTFLTRNEAQCRLSQLWVEHLDKEKNR